MHGSASTVHVDLRCRVYARRRDRACPLTGRSAAEWNALKRERHAAAPQTKCRQGQYME